MLLFQGSRHSRGSVRAVHGNEEGAATPLGPIVGIGSLGGCGSYQGFALRFAGIGSPFGAKKSCEVVSLYMSTDPGLKPVGTCRLKPALLPVAFASEGLRRSRYPGTAAAEILNPEGVAFGQTPLVEEGSLAAVVCQLGWGSQTWLNPNLAESPHSRATLSGSQ